jgi:hypothetical protein
MAYARHLVRCLIVFVTAMGLSSAFATASNAEPSPGVFGQMNRDHAKMAGLGESDLRDLAAKVPGSAVAAAGYAGPWFQYASTSVCNSAAPGSSGATDNSCTGMWTICNPTKNPASTRGPAVNVWSREVDATNTPVPGATWHNVGFTCLPELVPGASNVLTAAMILAQFHDTVFAKATAAVQPVKGTTLVNLPTYYAVQWPDEGFAPDEVDTTTLVGHQVRIKPVFTSANYVFGDGAESGPVASLGGPYPIGDIVHAYTHPADVQVRIDVTYGGQFSIDGGPWIDIPGTATVTGTPFPLHVAEAHAQLVTR